MKAGNQLRKTVSSRVHSTGAARTALRNSLETARDFSRQRSAGDDEIAVQSANCMYIGGIGGLFTAHCGWLFSVH